MEELWEELVRLLGPNTVSFPIENAGEARALRALQEGLWRTLSEMSSAAAYLEQDGTLYSIGQDPFAANIMSNALRILKEHPAEIRQNTNSSIVVSRLPIITDEGIQRFGSAFQRINGKWGNQEAVDFTMSIPAALAAEVRDRDIFPRAEGTPELARLQFYWTYYLNKKIMLQNSFRVDSKIASDIANLSGIVENYSSEFETERMRHRTELDSLNVSSIEIADKAKEASANVSAAREELTNFERTIREELRLDTAKRTWTTRYKEARKSFQIAVAILAVFFLVTMSSAVCFGPSLISFINRFDLGVFLTSGSVGTAFAHQLGRLVVFSIPALVYLWMLRAAMRYFMRSMLLMDDARQRETMLDTYFLLSEKGRADERDRPLILWALFRQTPGHGTDGIEPPDFTEVINAGMKRAQNTA